jgi:hypothetical protein
MEAKRTLVKSPPELWAELSDVAALARHLGEFGEIRITRTEPETVVEWEGDRASGSVRLEPSGWGTKVTLTSEVTAPEPPLPEEAAAAEEPVAAEPPPEPVAAEPPPEPVAAASPRPRGFARLLWWRRAAAPVDAAPGEPEAAPVAAARESEQPAAALLEPAPVEPEPEPPAVDAEAEPPVLDDERAAAILNGVLDALGAAHHRPFSR